MRTSKRHDEKNSGSEQKGYSRYGLTELGWNELTPEQREVHYNRQKVCDHPYVYPGIAGDVKDQRLREQFSHDPYFHTAHMIPHDPKDKNCECQSCALQIGIERGNRKRKVNEDELRERIKERLGL